LVFKDDYIITIGAHYDESLEKTLKYFTGLKHHEYPTAIMCFNDQQALGVLAAVKQLNLRVPEDISIIGNDDIYFAKLYPIPLTTIRAPKMEMGRRAAEILIKNIEAKQQQPVENVVLDCELKIRNSTQQLKTNL